MIWLDVLAWSIVLPLSIPLLVLAIECAAALIPAKPQGLPASETRPRCAVLIPAHNEERGIGATLGSLIPQLGPGDRIWVVADNCADRTAEVARSWGVEVVERNDSDRRGKGYALAFGREALNSSPPEVVVVVDADCRLSEQFLLRIVSEAVIRQRPIQAENILRSPEQAPPQRKIAAFAFLLKNAIRPLGLTRLGGPCLLTGTGMALPWGIFQGAKLASGHIVEDLGMTVELALAGNTAAFLPEARVFGEFPIDDRAASSQRRRWEHGHLRVLIRGVPHLIWASVNQRRPSLALLAFEIGVPPLSALALIVGTGWFGLFLFGLCGGSWYPGAMLAAASSSAALGVSLHWWRSGRAILPPATLIRIPKYILGKVRLYIEFLVKPQKEWVRTSRDP